MKSLIYPILISVIFLFSCERKKEVIKEMNVNYFSSKEKFDKNLINHFPSKIKTLQTHIVANTNKRKNDIGLFLYEYDLTSLEISKIIRDSKRNNIAHYNSNDLCLLVVNRFETIESSENFENAKINDSSLISKECYKKKLPIPNFVKYDEVDKNNPTKLSKDFDIYVLEAKSGNYFKKFDLQPDSQMPTDWENGYSKGIAVCQKKKTVIYWSIIW